MHINYYFFLLFNKIKFNGIFFIEGPGSGGEVESAPIPQKSILKKTRPKTARPRRNR